MDKNSTLSATDLFNEGLKCFNKPDGIGAVRAFEAVVKIDPAISSAIRCRVHVYGALL
jgi:hypothetical protein